MIRSLALSCVLAIAASAQESPRQKPEDYPVHVRLDRFELAAEYLVHAIPTQEGGLTAREYLIVEVAVFPAPLQTVQLRSNQFTLRINGKKDVLITQTPAMVAASLKYPDWEYRPRAEVAAGVGDKSVIFGRPPEAGRFPDDQRGRVPPRPKAPEETDPASMKAPRMSVDEQIARAALQEDIIHSAAHGCLFFRYEGKTKKIRSLDLLYETGDGKTKATLKLL